jgi:hypothetical protein
VPSSKPRVLNDLKCDDLLLKNFYTTARAGAISLSDGGGPLGFDISVALQIDHLVREFSCDGIVETGCHYGDTTEYLAKQYPDLPVVTCDIDVRLASFTQARCAEYPNAKVLSGDSAVLLPEMTAGISNPLVLLDAHWYEPWPLPQELRAVDRMPRAVVAIDDFFIGHQRFGFDSYARRCDAELVSEEIPSADVMFIGNPEASHAFPCLQVGRRAGVGYVVHGMNPDPIRKSGMFCCVDLRPPIRLPAWGSGALENK